MIRFGSERRACLFSQQYFLSSTAVAAARIVALQEDHASKASTHQDIRTRTNVALRGLSQTVAAAVVVVVVVVGQLFFGLGFVGVAAPYPLRAY